VIRNRLLLAWCDRFDRWELVWRNKDREVAVGGFKKDKIHLAISNRSQLAAQEIRRGPVALRGLVDVEASHPGVWNEFEAPPAWTAEMDISSRS